MADYDVSGPRFKIERAHKHIVELDIALKAFLAKKPYGIQIEEKNNLFEVWSEVREKIPTDIPLILGDAAHNMRSALDLLAGALVNRAGKDPKQARFPFGKTEESFEDGLKDIKGAGANVISAVRALKPYKTGGGNGARLFALHDLDIMDKHKLIIPIGQVMYQAFKKINAGIVATNGGFILSNEIGRRRHIQISGPGGVEYHADPGMEVRMLFGEDSPFPREELIGTLNSLKGLVAKTVEDLWAIQ